MSDVFISYARSTASQAHRIANALRVLGYSVWRDDDLPPNRSYADVIEEQLQSAKAVVVIWSAEAVKSQWVRSEADRARSDDKLVQIGVDGARLPMPFEQIQCADMAGWAGQSDHQGWSTVVSSIAELVGAAPTRQSAAPSGGGMSVRGAVPAEPVLAVLAFDNLSGDSEMAYFSDGVSEEIQQAVGRGTDLKVIGRASSFRFRGVDKAAAVVAANLRATHVLDGSVRRSGQRVRISTQLIECARETMLWSQQFDRDLTDIFALQDEIAAAVATALKVAFAPAAEPQPIDPLAYDLYLRVRARFLSALLSADLQGQALASLSEVVASAPTFARAWADLAWARAWSLRMEDHASFPGLTRAKVAEAAKTALGLDPNSGVAHQALGWLEPWGRYLEREALQMKALATDATDPRVVAGCGWQCAEVGRLKESLGYAQQAMNLDPLFPEAAQWNGAIRGGMGRYAEAAALYDEMCARWPDSEVIAGNAMAFAAESRDWERFERLVQGAAERGIDGRTFKQGVRHYRNLAAPHPEYAARYLQFAREGLERTGFVSLVHLVGLHALGLEEEAFDLIDRAAFAHMMDQDGPAPAGSWTPGLIFFESNKPMIRDVRFVGLCAKLGLCDYWVMTDRWPDCADEVDYDFRAEARARCGLVS